MPSLSVRGLVVRDAGDAAWTVRCCCHRARGRPAVCEPRNARPAQVASPEGATLLRALLAPLLAARAGLPPVEAPRAGEARPGSVPAPAAGSALLALQIADAVVRSAPGAAAAAAAGGAGALRSLLAGCGGPAGRPGRAGGSGRAPDAWPDSLSRIRPERCGVRQRFPDACLSRALFTFTLTATRTSAWPLLDLPCRVDERQSQSACLSLLAAWPGYMRACLLRASLPSDACL